MNDFIFNVQHYFTKKDKNKLTANNKYGIAPLKNEIALLWCVFPTLGTAVPNSKLSGK